MKNKKDNSDPIDNLEYEKVLEEEIINSYESKFQKDTEEDSKKIKFYRLKRTPLEILIKNKKNNSDPIDNLEYEKVLEEEIINSYESKFQKDTEEDLSLIHI